MVIKVENLPISPATLAQLVSEHRHLSQQRDMLQRRLNEVTLERRSPATLAEQVRSFRKLFNLPVGAGSPQVPQAPGRARAHVRLILEEVEELFEACFTTDFEVLFSVVRAALEDAEERPDLVAIADALADIDYLAEGFRQELGVDGAPIAQEVHRSNMAKRGAVVSAITGKLSKPEGWSPPNIAEELQKQGWRPTNGVLPVGSNGSGEHQTTC
jgi:predicted HAD superfamily Cof-like phosphohydrolase